MRAVDTHAHLDFRQFDEDRTELIAELNKEELGVIDIATDLESSQKAADLADNNDLIWATIGLHPTQIGPDTLEKLFGQLERLKSLALSKRKVVAVGEIGLDYFRDESRQQAETQKAVLRQFLTLAIELDLPVIFHCRDAYGDLLTILADYPSTRGVIHCFTGSSEEAQKFLDLGLSLSFTATITFPENELQRLAVSAVPLEKIMLETDSPFLAPFERRGTRNDPWTIFDVARTIAEVKKIDEAEVLEKTTSNAKAFFGLVSKGNEES